MPLFSIIVPVYNTEQYLNRCFDSILNQKFSDFELILVDDGSTDNSAKICDNYAELYNNIKVIHKKNGGVSSARNEGVYAANGEFLWFVDSDDYIEPFSLEQLSDIITEVEADLYVFNNGIVKEKFNGSLDAFFKKYYFNYIISFEPWNKIYRRDIILDNDIRFDTEESIGEDLLFNIGYYSTIRLDKGIFFIGNNYYNYIDRFNSAMNSQSEGRLVQQLRLFDKIEIILREKVSEDTLNYLFLLHLISGVNQSKAGGLSAKRYSTLVDFSKYKELLYKTKWIISDFYVNENTSFLGKIRMTIFLSLMKSEKYFLAGKIMGLK